MISLKSKITLLILDYFFLNPQAKKYTNELARLFQVDPKNLDRKLKELEKEGLLKSEFSGKQRYFFLNRRYSLLKEYKKIILKTVGFEKKLTEKLALLPGLIAAYIFGSYAKNKMDAASDIDILLVGDHSSMEAQKLVLPLQKEIQREINVIDMSKKEFAAKKKEPPGLFKERLGLFDQNFMIQFETDYFQKLNFTPPQLKQYFQAAVNDLAIADKTKETEVIFRFAYDAFIKLGIALIAKQGLKARSVAGHHVKIIEKLSQILADNDIEIYGNQMRKLRNIDFYEGGALITEKQAEDFLEFVRKVFKRAADELFF